MLLVLLTCFALLHLSAATDLINAIKRKLFRNADLRNDSSELQELSKLIEDAVENREIDARDEHWFSPLILATYDNLFILPTGKLPDQRLSFFTGENSKLISELLLNNGANVNAQSRKGCTALMHAAHLNNLDVVDLLLRKGANPNLQNEHGETALDLIRNASNNYEPVRAKIKEFLVPPLIRAIKSKQFHDADLQDDSPELRELSTLIEDAVKASEKGYYSGIDEHESVSGLTALHYAIQCNDHYTGKNSKLICELLLNNGADPNKRTQDICDSTPLMDAAMFMKPDLVKLLLRNGANPYLTESGKTAHHMIRNYIGDECAPILKLYMDHYNKGWRILNGLNSDTFFIQKNINHWPVKTRINEFLNYHPQPKKFTKCKIQPKPYAKFGSESAYQTSRRQELVHELMLSSETEPCRISVKDKTNESDNNPKN